ncbi:invasion associated locus B family protein [Altererythrobacter sp. CAU 1778]
MQRIALSIAAATAALCASPLMARDSLGVFDNWAAFRDRAAPRCYAIAMAQPSSLSRDFEPFATVGTWPKKGVRGQIHFRFSRRMAKGATIRLAIGDKRFELVGGGADGWAADRRMDAAIVAAMRSAGRMTVGSVDERGRRFSNTYRLTGVATAMDAATLGCARLR